MIDNTILFVAIIFTQIFVIIGILFMWDSVSMITNNQELLYNEIDVLRNIIEFIDDSKEDYIA